jgi:anti-sigma factor RsiW
VIGHVGTKVSALVDGQLPAAEADRLWAHVHGCPPCRRQVEREGWVKTRLAGLALCGDQPCAPRGLKGALAEVRGAWSEPPAPAVAEDDRHERRRVMMVAALGAGSLGAAMVGVLAMSVPAQTPGVERRGPVTSMTRPTLTPATRAPSTSLSPRLAQVGTTQQKWVRITP